MIINSEFTSLGFNSLLYKSGPVKYTDYIQNKYNNVHNRMYQDALNLFLKDFIKSAFYDEGYLFDDALNAINSINEDDTTDEITDMLKRNEGFARVACFSDYQTGKLINEIIELRKSLLPDKEITENDLFNILKKYFLKTHRIVELKNEEYYMPSLVVIFYLYKPFHKVGPYSLEEYWKSEFVTNTMGNKREIDEEENLEDLEITNIDYVRGKADLESRLTGIKTQIDFDEINNDIAISDDYLDVYKKTFSGLR